MTGGGGSHAYFRSSERRFRNSASLLAPGLDIRADGGYVVAPPSNHISGTPYRWEIEYGIHERDIATFPVALEERLIAARKTASNADRERGPDAKIPSGDRHASYLRLASRMAYWGCNAPTIFAALRAHDETRCEHPKRDYAELRRIADAFVKGPVGSDIYTNDGVSQPRLVDKDRVNRARAGGFYA